MQLLFETITMDFRDEEVEPTLSAIIKKSQQLAVRQWHELALSCIDLTTLNSTDTPLQGENMALKVSGFSEHFPGVPNVAAICVYPKIVESVKKITSATRSQARLCIGRIPIISNIFRR